MIGGDSFDHRTRINCYNGLGLLLRNKKEFERSIQDFRRAYEIALVNRDTAWMSILAGNIGSIHLEKNDYDSSLYYYFKNLQLIKRTTEFENEIETYAQLARVYLKKNNPKSTKTYLDILKKL
jgi:tetratricopeptide (TPR) repeat protein